ncbi:MAG: hypothetical protein ACRBBW_16330 [Cellvibrionaceae bacterium]
MRKIFLQARARSAQKDLEFSITFEWCMEQLREQDYRCRHTKIPLQLRDPFSGDTANPWSPSLDRYHSSFGYTPENTHLVSSIYNYAKNTYTHEDVVRFSKELLNNEI